MSRTLEDCKMKFTRLSAFSARALEKPISTICCTMAGSGWTWVLTAALPEPEVPALSIPFVHFVRMVMILCATSGDMEPRSALVHRGMTAADIDACSHEKLAERRCTSKRLCLQNLCP